VGFVSVDVSLVLELVNVLTGKDFCHFAHIRIRAPVLMHYVVLIF
jgi:hypothetical protein